MGVLLLSIPCRCLFLNIVSAIPDWGLVLLFLIAAYIVGLINCMITECIWAKFRNNIGEIQAQYDSFDGDSQYVIRDYGICVFVIYISVCVALWIIMWADMLFVAAFIIPVCFLRTAWYREPYSGGELLTRYYKEYYFVEKHRPENAVKIIEAQVAFLKNICLPLCAVSLFIINTVRCPYIQVWVAIISVLSLMAMITVAVRRQNTIYRIVIEDYKYLSNMKM